MNAHGASQPDFIGATLIAIGTALIGVGAVQTAGSHQNIWLNPWFDSGFTMVLFGAVPVIRTIVSWWSNWRSRSVAKPGMSIRATDSVTSAVNPLLLRAGRGDWRPFDDALWAFAIPVRITNLTDELITLKHYHVQSRSDEAQRPPIAQEALNSAVSWMAKFSAEHESERFEGEIAIPPGESVTRWFVSWVYARLSDGGRPAITLRVKDILNNTYELDIPAYPGETYPSP